ncbi:hypothetical protein PT2222_50163 [Paraburkholderia tropica]
MCTCWAAMSWSRPRRARTRRIASVAAVRAPGSEFARCSKRLRRLKGTPTASSACHMGRSEWPAGRTPRVRAGRAGGLSRDESGAEPGQAAEAPSRDRLAMAFGVLVAFEAFEQIVGVREAGFGRFDGRELRAGRAAAEEQHGRVGVADGALELGDEVGVRHAAWVARPFDVGILAVADHGAAHPVEFGARAHVDEPGTRIELQKLERLGGRQCAGVGQLVLDAALVGLGVQLFERTHDSGSPRMRDRSKESF